MRKVGRSRFHLYAAAFAFGQCLACDASAQNYPNKPVYMVLGSAAGGGVDSITRVLAPNLSDHLGQPVVIENRAGASGAIATERVAKALADGYTLTLLSSNAVIVSVLRTNLPYSLERDLAPVSLVTSAPQVLVVHPSVPARNVKELIALARSRPGKLNYGSDGVGSFAHLVGELFSSMANVKLVHVPYKGAPAAAMATAAGETSMNFPSLTSALPFLKTGKFRLLAVTSAKRSSLMPTIPTLDESGVPGYDNTNWMGVFAPAAVPKNILAQLNAALGKVVNTPEMKESINKIGQEPQTNSPEQFAAFVRSETAKFAKLINLIGLEAE